MKSSMVEKFEFAPVDYSQWVEMAKKALKGADFDEALVHKSDDDLFVGPIYPRADLPHHIPIQKDQPNWTIVQRIDDSDVDRARVQLLEDIQGGANAIALIFEGAPNAFGRGLPADPKSVETLLQGVDLENLHIRIDVHPSIRKSLDWFVSAVGKKRVNPAKLDLSFGIDSCATFASTGRLRMSIEAIKASLPQSLAHFFSLQVPSVLLEADGRVYHNAGASEAQELGAMLAAALTHMRMFEEARQPLAHCTPFIGLCLSADQNQFMTIAKLRAARILWHRLNDLCGLESKPARIHVETSMRMMTKKDVQTNILRSTIACFSAAIGGADSISVLPHTIAHGLPDAFSRRLARNTQLILSQESHIGIVSDPGAGSGAIETLTEQLCQSAWEEFQRIEREGGMLESLKEGHFQARIEEKRLQRDAKYQSGEAHLVGSTIFPIGTEPAITTLECEERAAPVDGSVHCQKLNIAPLEQNVEHA